MFSIRTAVVTGFALLFVGAGAAQAADLYGPRGGMKDPPPAYVPSVVTQPSWYARFDFAFGRHDTPEMIENGTIALDSERIDSTWSFGGGIGRRFTPNIRGDLTWERRVETDASGIVRSQTTLPGTRTFGLESDVYLANLYYDFATSGRFTPYVGIGLGLVNNKTKAGTVTDTCGCTGIIEGENKWSVAGAFMTGVTIALRQRQSAYGDFQRTSFAGLSQRGLYLDMGYRFLYLGDATTGVIRPTATNTTTTVSQDPAVESIHAHEFRVGLRMDLN